MRRKLQVFVSSTYTDLLEERQAAVAAILKAGHIPAGMELFTAGDISQMETIKRWIDESDVYMLILGGRYGSVEMSTGLSYTELEYDYARQQGKPSFAVVIRDEALEAKIKINGTAFLEKDNPKELALFRKKVLSNISSFFSDAKDVKLCVYESLSDFSTNTNLKGWISASEIEDNRRLTEELSKLREENAILSDKIKRAESNPPTTIIGLPDDAELTRVLEAIEIKVPPELTETRTESSHSVFDIAYQMRDLLVNGVTNSTSTAKMAVFLYHNIMPKLQTYGLAENEKVTGAQYRRSALTKAGREFFARHERMRVLAKPSANKITGNTVVEDATTREHPSSPAPPSVSGKRSNSRSATKKPSTSE